MVRSGTVLAFGFTVLAVGDVEVALGVALFAVLAGNVALGVTVLACVDPLTESGATLAGALLTALGVVAAMGATGAIPTVWGTVAVGRTVCARCAKLTLVKRPSIIPQIKVFFIVVTSAVLRLTCGQSSALKLRRS